MPTGQSRGSDWSRERDALIIDITDAARRLAEEVEKGTDGRYDHIRNQRETLGSEGYRLQIANFVYLSCQVASLVRRGTNRANAIQRVRGFRTTNAEVRLLVGSFVGLFDEEIHGFALQRLQHPEGGPST